MRDCRVELHGVSRHESYQVRDELLVRLIEKLIEVAPELNGRRRGSLTLDWAEAGEVQARLVVRL